MANNNSGFYKKKIYENLAYQPKPLNYNKKISWIVQQQIAATNGIHYIDLVGKLDNYPIPNLPVSNVPHGLMLDIGCGWGRWLVAGAKKGYIPIGFDLRLDLCRAARNVMHSLGHNGYVVVADLKNLPFKSNIFDLVWSFSTLQHVHKKKLLSCLCGINEVLSNDGFCLHEFPNKNGIRNRIVNVKKSQKEGYDYNSLCVRYYSIKEYRKMFENIFNNFKYENHSFIGIGILPGDLKYVSFKNKIGVAISVSMSFLTKVITPLKQISDSIYVRSFKNNKINKHTYVELKSFLKAHSENPDDNLNLRHLICCPVSRCELTLNKTRTEFVSQKAGLAFPVVDGIPILIQEEARRL